MTVLIDYSLIMNKILHLLSSDLEEKLKSLGVEGFLDYLGDMRLQQKKVRMENLLKIANPDEALYREIMLALGYKNKPILMKHSTEKLCSLWDIKIIKFSSWNWL
jgi:hypothetical protein